MPLIYLETIIHAEPMIVFNLSRSVDLHKASMTHHKEEIISGVKSGLMNKGDIVTWTANHLGRRRTLTVKLTESNAPHSFIDEMVNGDFTKMRHEHRFIPAQEGTLMIDEFYFESPFGWIGQLANFLFLKTYMTQLLQQRNRIIKQTAESNQAKQYL